MITLYDQTTFSDKETGTHGDCYRATTATLLQIDPTTLPHPIAESGDWNPDFWKALRQMGFTGRSVAYSALVSPRPSLSDDGIIPPFWRIPRVVLAAGISERGIRHSVVWDRFADRMIHDPHPSRAGLIEVDALDYFAPLAGGEEE